MKPKPFSVFAVKYSLKVTSFALLMKRRKGLSAYATVMLLYRPSEVLVECADRFGNAAFRR